VTEASREPTNAGAGAGDDSGVLKLLRNEDEDEDEEGNPRPRACTAARAPPTAPNKSRVEGEACLESRPAAVHARRAEERGESVSTPLLLVGLTEEEEEEEGGGK
jgi:hypothetical protein